ncbi:hypothetical protein ACH4CE_16290 [Streptomyces gelaticus]|uniref:hypothetical protein n=1 Tax=Streptomyces gelaticus TaxID=285446 RepID=UPI0037A38D7A
MVNAPWHPAGSRPRTRPPWRLALIFTLPGDIRSAFIGRTAISAALEAHGLAPYAWPTAHAVTELMAVTARMSPGKELYVSLRQQDDAVRLLVWDQHPRHRACCTPAGSPAVRAGAVAAACGDTSGHRAKAGSF